MVDLGKIVGAGLDLVKVQEVVDFVFNRRDDLLAAATLATELPKLLRVLATGLTEAGEHAQLAGAALSGTAGATGRVGNTAKTLTQFAANLTVITDLVGSAADEVGKVPLMGLPAKQLGKAARLAGETRSGMEGLSDDLVAIAQLLDSIGGSLDGLGKALGASGDTTQKFVG